MRSKKAQDGPLASTQCRLAQWCVRMVSEGPVGLPSLWPVELPLKHQEESLQNMSVFYPGGVWEADALGHSRAFVTLCKRVCVWLVQLMCSASFSGPAALWTEVGLFFLTIVSEGCVPASHAVGTQPVVKEGRKECMAIEWVSSVAVTNTEQSPIRMPYFMTGCGNFNSVNSLVPWPLIYHHPPGPYLWNLT